MLLLDGAFALGQGLDTMCFDAKQVLQQPDIL